MVQLLLILLLAQAPTAPQTRTGTLTGVLRSNRGFPLEGVRIAATPADEAIADAVLESLALTDATGRFLLENVSPGRYRILVGRTGNTQYFPGVALPERAATFQVAAGAAVDVGAMELVRSSVSGRVVDLDTGAGRKISSLQLCCDVSQAQVVPWFAIAGVSMGRARLNRLRRLSSRFG